MEELRSISKSVQGNISKPQISPYEAKTRNKITDMLQKYDNAAKDSDRLTAYEMYILWKMAKDSDDVFAELAIMAYKAGYVRGCGSRKKVRA